jgi:3-phosphoshikimate 1-carboxyvinyltransferase
MRRFGAEMSNDGYRRFHVRGGQRYTARDHAIEPDASGASYFFAAAAVTGGRVRVLHLVRDSAQGDLRFVDVLERMGCQVEWGPDWVEVRGPAGGRLRGVDVDMNAISDTVQTLAAIAPFADGPVTMRDIGHIRVKETDRLEAVATELRRLGVPVETGADWLRVHPATPQPGTVETYDDHRMAMSFSVLGLRTPGVRIRNPGCVAKTFPDFFSRFAALTGADSQRRS